MELSSRERILKNAAQNKPAQSPLPDTIFLGSKSLALLQQFGAALYGVGGIMYNLYNYQEVLDLINRDHPGINRIYSTISEVKQLLYQPACEINTDHELADVDVAIIQAHFGVAENGAVWITDEQLLHRTLPFIAQHLAVVINKVDICPTMHEAYLRIAEYNYGVFIAGPSKTADIEQSLVIGAHGPRSMTVFVMETR